MSSAVDAPLHASSEIHAVCHSPRQECETSGTKWRAGNDRDRPVKWTCRQHSAIYLSFIITSTHSLHYDPVTKVTEEFPTMHFAYALLPLLAGANGQSCSARLSWGGLSGADQKPPSVFCTQGQTLLGEFSFHAL